MKSKFQFKNQLSDMANTQLLQLIKDGFAAMKTGSEMAAKATSEISDAAQHPKLKEALEKGSKTSEKWAERIERGLQEAGASEKRNNFVIEAIGKVNQEILKSAPDANSRDLGIIAGGQLALHYWIAAFGTMHSYASEAELDQTKDEMKACLKEAKEADEEQTKIAEEIMGQS